MGFNAGARKGRGITDLSLRTGVKLNDVTIAAFVNNATGNDTALFQTLGTRAGAYGARAYRNTNARPRTMGVSVDYRF